MSETNVYRVTITHPNDPDIKDLGLGDWYITDVDALMDLLDRGKFGVIPAYEESE